MSYRSVSFLFLLALLPPVTWAQATPLSERVLVLVNDRMPRETGTGSLGASLFVGQHYAAQRKIPPSNILHLKTSPGEVILMDEYKSEIEGPLRKFLDANGGAMRRKILYIVPTYGVPVQINQTFSVDSVISMMYAGHDELKPPLRNPYAAPVGSRPPHFDAWSDGTATANNFKMFIVCRLDGPSALIANALVDKAIAAESSLTMKSGIAYFDYQGTREPKEWQYAIDNEIKAAAELARNRGFQTVVNVQRDSICGAPFMPANTYVYDPAAHTVTLDMNGSVGSMSFSFSPLTEGDFRVEFKASGVQNHGNTLTVTLGGASAKDHIRLLYPFVPFHSYDTTSAVELEEQVGGAVTAHATLQETNAAQKEINELSDLRVSVRKGQISVYRNGAPLLSAPSTGAPPSITTMSIALQCWTAAVAGFSVTSADGKPIFTDTFATDSTAKYQWNLAPIAGLNALWAWGWYVPAYDSYRFVPGAVGAQLTSFTATKIRTPRNPDPAVFHRSTARWGGDWVPRMLEQGVTATWGAVTEPYAIYYAPGGNVFDHLWAGYNFGESFYIAQNAVRWVMTAIGDPLYTPAIFAEKR